MEVMMTLRITLESTTESIMFFLSFSFFPCCISGPYFLLMLGRPPAFLFWEGFYASLLTFVSEIDGT